MRATGGSSRRRRVGTLLGLALLPACYQGYDPVDPETLAEIMRTRGDAEGIELSGLYRGRFDVLSCGCDQEMTTFDVTLCAALEEADRLGIETIFDVVVIQADGSMRVSEEGFEIDGNLGAPLLPTLYGPLDADGTLSIAGILQTDALLVEGQVLSRIDGTLDEDGLSGELQQRYHLSTDVTDGAPIEERPGGGSTPAEVDCREWIGLDLVRLGPPPLPLPPD